MKRAIIILFFAVLACAGIGFIVRPSDLKTGELLIGLAVAVSFFVLMPMFIYHRWKNRSVKDYMLTKENIEKMRSYGEDKKL